MNQDDLDRIADNGRMAAGLLQSRGVAALERSHQWKGAIRAANYDPTGGSGWRYEEHIAADGTVEVWPVPNDPTGEAGAQGQAHDQLAHARLSSALNAYNQAALVLQQAILTVAPEQPPRADDEGPGEGWCSSCYRIDRRLEPEAIHASGVAKYKGLCSWCGSFKRSEGRLPPPVLLRKHLDGKRITEEDKDRAMPDRKKKAS